MPQSYDDVSSNDCRDTSDCTVKPPQPPYAPTATAIERYPDILRGNRFTPMFLWQHEFGSDRGSLSRPSRAQLTKLIDDAITAGYTFRLTSMPHPAYTYKVRVTYRDMMEDHEKEKVLGIQSVTMALIPVKWAMHVRRLLFGQFKEMYIYSVDRVE